MDMVLPNKLFYSDFNLFLSFEKPKSPLCCSTVKMGRKVTPVTSNNCVLTFLVCQQHKRKYHLNLNYYNAVSLNLNSLLISTTFYDVATKICWFYLPPWSWTVWGEIRGSFAVTKFCRNKFVRLENQQCAEMIKEIIDPRSHSSKSQTVGAEPSSQWLPNFGALAQSPFLALVPHLCTSLFFHMEADWAFGTRSMEFTSSSISSLKKSNLN